MSSDPYKPAPELQDSNPENNRPRTKMVGVFAVIVIVVLLIGLLLPATRSALYDSIDLSKPWDDPANAKAYASSVPVYHCPSLGSGLSLGSTTYLGVVAPHGFFLPTGSRRLSEIIDSPSETLMVVEVPSVNSVHWMQPVDANESMPIGIRQSQSVTHQGDASD